MDTGRPKPPAPRRRGALAGATALALTLLTSAFYACVEPARIDAMPPFAQAVGQNCTLCHTMMPGLNAYGRYILRTFYNGIGGATFHGTSPVWLNENVTGRSTRKLDSTQPNKTMTFANLSADVSGLGEHWSYRVEQKFWTNDQSGGGLGNAWAGYSLGESHLRLGKFARPVASVFTNNWYRTGFSAPSVAVGNHAYSLSGSGFATEYSYTHSGIQALAGYYVQGNNLPNSSTFLTTPGTQRSFSWQVAWATPNRPLEVGTYGSVGTFTQTSSVGAIDFFNGNGFYVQRDAQPKGTFGIPGAAAIYQVMSDSNPGLLGKLQRPPGNAWVQALQIEEPLFAGRAMIGTRREIINSVGTVTKGQVFDAGLQVPGLPYLFVYGEAAMGNAYTSATFGRPTWRWAMRWAGPITGPLNRIK